MRAHASRWIVALMIGIAALWQGVQAQLLPSPPNGYRIALIGSGLGEQLQYDGGFEALLHQRFPAARLTIRNLCVPADTPAYRPRAGRSVPGAFPGAEHLRPDHAVHRGQGVEPSPDEWLALCNPDLVLGFFGWNESFDGASALPKFRTELEAWIDHSRQQPYHGKSTPNLVLVSPIAFEDLSASRDLPDGTIENGRLAEITEVMRSVAKQRAIGFIDVFTPSRTMMEKSSEPLTTNGFLPNAFGNRWLAEFLADALFGNARASSAVDAESLRQLVIDKDWHCRNDFRIPNGVHVYGVRREPFGTVNYPQEIEKLRQLATNRDRAIHAAANGEAFDLDAADAATRQLDPVPSNFPAEVQYRSGEEAIQSMTMMEGFRVSLFACERRFPELRNPVQMSFDNRGRLWVAVMPSYPHHKPGDPKPNDKILIFEDSDGDGKADRSKVFADQLHLPTGFDIQPDGVYVSAQPSLLRLRDTDGDDVADVREWIMHGFDTHDTHHAISTFVADPTGALLMLEGKFLHSNVETPYGPRRDSDSGVWRFDPRSLRMERYSQAPYYNPWGLAIDSWGQPFLNDASSGENWWLPPLTVQVAPGKQIRKIAPIEPRRARPTSGAEIISSRHFPDELQGALMTHNVIGFLGTSVHRIEEDGSGFTSRHVGDLISSSDPNFRPVDLEFAPDGSLYLIDWHNALIGHMQHSARDPKRDRNHGRVYRITHATRPLVMPVPIAEAPVEQLVRALEEPESRTRSRARNELRGRNADEVISALRKWMAGMNAADPTHDARACEALWVSCGLGQPERDFLLRCLNARSHQARAAAVEVIRNEWRRIPDHAGFLMQAARDTHPRVRLAAIVAATWIGGKDGANVLVEALNQPVDRWMVAASEAAIETLKPHLTSIPTLTPSDALTSQAATPQQADDLSGLSPEEQQQQRLGREVFHRDSHCATCHGAEGVGDAVYPPLVGSEWIRGNEERLIKLTLKGLWGPIEVNGKQYDPAKGVPPMIGFEHLLNDQELAAVLSYARRRFGNGSAPVKPETVARIRESLRSKTGFYTVEELLREHPLGP